MAVISLKNISRTYSLDGGENAVHALRGVDLSVEQGDFIAIMGASGSGKSTLMNILGCLDSADSGSYSLDGTEISSLTEKQKSVIRNRRIGFVFQSFNLLPRTSAVENVERPLLYLRPLAGEEKIKIPAGRERRKKAESLLREVGLESRMNHPPNEFSGGQQQRVAIARAMVNDPAFILADEPTGNLDSTMSLEILALFQRLNAAGKTIIMVTHEAAYAAYCKRIVTLRDGKITGDERIEMKDAAADLEKLKSEGVSQ